VTVVAHIGLPAAREFEMRNSECSESAEALAVIFVQFAKPGFEFCLPAAREFEMRNEECEMEEGRKAGALEAL